MTFHALTSLALDSAPGPAPGSEALDQSTAGSQSAAGCQETGSGEAPCELAPNIPDVEVLIQEAAVSAMHLRLAARIIVRGAARLASSSTRASGVSVTLD